MGAVRLVVFVVSAIALLAAAEESDLVLCTGGKVELRGGGASCGPVVYGRFPDGRLLWGGCMGKDGPDAAARLATFTFMQGGKIPHTEGTLALSEESGGVRISVSGTVKGERFGDGGLGLRLSVPAGAISNVTWTGVDGTCRRIGEDGVRHFVKPARISALSLAMPGGGFKIIFDEATTLTWHDARPDADMFVLRFSRAGKTKVAKGETVRFSMLVSRTDGTPTTVGVREQFVVKAGRSWIPCKYLKTPEKGSALDFSEICRRDVPAGRYGFLKAVDGHFEFEGRPGEAVRFWGANITSSACFPKTDDDAAALAERLARIGYNSVRIHHHDWGCAKGVKKSGELNSDYMARLDRFIYECIERGLYITTDLYVSRDVPWRDIGLDRPGLVGHNRFKGEILYREAAYSNYCAFAKAFLEHVNPHTGRRYADEPALNLISLVNEGLFFSGWNSLSSEPLFRDTWKTWLEKRRRSDPDCFPGFSPDAPPGGIYDQKTTKGPRAEILAAFSSDKEREFYGRMRVFLKGIGVKALLTDVNFGPATGAIREMRHEFDYVDTHFYYEHPKKKSGYFSIPNEHPLAQCSGKELAFAAKRFPDRPFTVSEYNWCGPCAYRNVGALLGACVAAKQDWSGVWRFAYAQRASILPDCAGSPDAFDVATDPVNYAAEKAAVALYLRGDMSSTPMLSAPSLSSLVGGGFSFDAKTKTVMVNTPLTAGGAAPAGVGMDVGAVSFRVEGADACVWVSSLDGRPIAQSGRMLMAHVTDVLGDGARFTDSTRQNRIYAGTRPLAQVGIVELRIRRSVPDSCVVYRLDMSGRRLAAIPARLENGGLSFIANVAYDATATIFYEISDP